MASVDMMLATGKSVGAICEAAGLDVHTLPDFETGVQLISALRSGDRAVDAISFLAHALPKREAIWWAWSCARHAAGDQPSEAIQASLDATGRWIAEPTDANRRQAYDLAQKADLATPAGCAGAAAFFSGGSIGPPDQPEMPPGEFMAAKVISGAVLLATTVEPAEADARVEDYLQKGLEVAERVGLWEARGPGGAG